MTDNNFTPYPHPSGTPTPQPSSYNSPTPHIPTPAPTHFAPIEPPLDQPWYGIDFMNAMKRFFKKYATFSGRASRGEYWWSYLGITIASYALMLLMLIPYLGMIFGIAIIFASIAVIIPSIAIAIRRLHDTNRSGWWLLLGYGLIMLGALVMVIGAFATIGTNIEHLDYMSDEETLAFVMSMLGSMVIGMLIMFAGSITQLILMALPSKPEGARFDTVAPTQQATYTGGQANTSQPYPTAPAPTPAPAPQYETQPAPYNPPAQHTYNPPTAPDNGNTQQNY